MGDSSKGIVKKRKTLDEYLGINGLLIFAIICAVFLKGGILEPIGVVAGLSALYYLIKKRKILTKKQKYVGWALFILWLLTFGLIRPFQ